MGAATPQEGLLGRELVVVTGKGGCGKSTVAAALGLAASRRGVETIVAEVDARTDVARALGAKAGAPSVEWIPAMGDAERRLAELLAPGDLCLVMGAGDIRTLGENLVTD